MKSSNSKVKLKQLIDNKINMIDAAGYIERTFIGEVKLWFLNLGEEDIKTLRNTQRYGRKRYNFSIKHTP